MDTNQFESACGVGNVSCISSSPIVKLTIPIGFSITPEGLDAAVSAYLNPKEPLSWDKANTYLSGTKQENTLKWANNLDVKNSLESHLAKTLGPKPAAPAKGKGKETKKVPAPAASSSTTTTDAAAPVSTEVNERSVFEEGFLGRLHKVGGNPQKHDSRRKEHLEWTNGNVFTRFPPEPNGYLHIGHAKAIFVNFGYAAHYGGHCYLRFDDTNPEAEEARYFESILEVIRWLGFEPYQITYSSDHFQKLYELAVDLTKRGLAYVCHCTGGL